MDKELQFLDADDEHIGTIEAIKYAVLHAETCKHTAQAKYCAIVWMLPSARIPDYPCYPVLLPMVKLTAKQKRAWKVFMRDFKPTKNNPSEDFIKILDNAIKALFEKTKRKTNR